MNCQKSIRKANILFLLVYALMSSGVIASASEAEWNKLLEEGRKEGKVVVVGPPIPGLRKAYIEEFRKDTGIELLYEGLGPRVSSPRVEREAAAGQLSVDVLVGGSSELLNLYPKKLLAPVRAVLVAPDVLDLSKWADGKLEFTDPEGQYFFRTISGVYGGILINTKKVPKGALKNSADLLKPEWKKKIISTPVEAGSGSGFATNVLYRLKSDYFTKLYKGQQVSFLPNVRAVVEAVARGTYSMGFGIFPEEVEALKSEGFPLEVIYLKDLPGYVSASYGTAKLVKGSPHPKAGAVFVNWFGGRKAQELLMKETINPSRRTDVNRDLVPHYTLPEPGVDYLDQHQFEFYTKYRRQVRKEINKIMGR